MCTKFCYSTCNLDFYHSTPCYRYRITFSSYSFECLDDSMLIVLISTPELFTHGYTATVQYMKNGKACRRVDLGHECQSHVCKVLLTSCLPIITTFLELNQHQILPTRQYFSQLYGCLSMSCHSWLPVRLTIKRSLNFFSIKSWQPNNTYLLSLVRCQDVPRVILQMNE